MCLKSLDILQRRRKRGNCIRVPPNNDRKPHTKGLRRSQKTSEGKEGLQKFLYGKIHDF